MKEQLSPLPNPENKRINFELDVEGIKIPCWKEDILYPKDIQKETQMEGYEKIRVRWDDFFTFMQKDLGITETIDESDLYKKFSKLLTTAKEKDLKQEAGIEIYEYDIEKKLMEKFLGSFSGGRYPKAMYVHSLYGDHEYPIAEDGSDIHKEFLQDGMFLGKIDSIPIRSVSGSWLFSNVRTPKLIINEKNEVEFFGQLLQEPTGKITGMKYGGPTDSKFADSRGFENKNSFPLTKEEYDEKIKHVIILDSMNGLNLEDGKAMWGLSRPTFGFDSQEKPFSKYLEKVKNLYEKLPPNLVGTFNKKCVSFMLQNSADKYKAGGLDCHPMIPIMIGDTGLPALRWGHCKYASMPTKDSINLITLRHTSE